MQIDHSSLRPVFFLVGMAFVIRMYLAFFSGHGAYSTDSLTYLNMANAILEGHPISYFPNGYPLLMAATRLFVAEQTWPIALQLINVLLSSVLVLLTYLCGKQLLGHKLALGAALTLAIWPNQLNYSRMIMSEVPSAFLLMAGIATLSSNARSTQACAGSCMFLAGMFRSTLLPIGPLTLLYLITTKQFDRAKMLAIGLVIGFAANGALVTYKIVAPSDNLGENLLIAVHSMSTDTINYSTNDFTQAQRQEPVETYLDFAQAHPVTFIQQRVASLWELWGPWPVAGDTNAPRSTLTRLMIGARFPVLTLALIGLAAAKASRQAALYAIPIVVITLAHTAFFSTARFTVPVEPCLVILAWGGVRHLAVRLRIVDEVSSMASLPTTLPSP